MTLAGDNGLLNRTVGAKNKTKLAEAQEIANLEYEAGLIDSKVNATSVAETIENIKKSTEKTSTKKTPILVAVSKKRSVESIQVIYNLGQRIFGENYPQELLTKSKTLPKDIEWHLIGHLQTNKVKKVLEEIPNIVIESVDRIDVVKKISQYADTKNKTKIYLEINISGEDSKTGCPIKDIYNVLDEIFKNKDKMELIGIMSLGTVGNKKE